MRRQISYWALAGSVSEWVKCLTCWHLTRGGSFHVDLIVVGDHCRSVDVTMVPAVRHNGTMYAHVFVLPTTAHSPQSTDWVNTQTVPLTKYELPQATTFQLIGDSADSKVRRVPPWCFYLAQIVWTVDLDFEALCKFMKFCWSNYQVLFIKCNLPIATTSEVMICQQDKNTFCIYYYCYYCRYYYIFFFWICSLLWHRNIHLQSPFS